MISVVALPGESLVAGGAPEPVVIRVGLLMLEHVCPAAERLLTKQTLVGLDTWWRGDFVTIRADTEDTYLFFSFFLLFKSS